MTVGPACRRERGFSPFNSLPVVAIESGEIDRQPWRILHSWTTPVQVRPLGPGAWKWEVTPPEDRFTLTAALVAGLWKRAYELGEKARTGLIAVDAARSRTQQK